MHCRDLMRLSVFVCNAHDTVTRCAQVMKERNIGFLPVVDAGSTLVGVITDRDLAVRVLAEGRGGDTSVGTVMSRALLVCSPDEELEAAEERMASHACSRLVVVDGEGRCLGVITIDDIAQAESRRRAGKVLQDVTRERVGQKR
jgi:CBS domain-containing protein